MVLWVDNKTANTEHEIWCLNLLFSSHSPNFFTICRYTCMSFLWDQSRTSKPMKKMKQSLMNSSSFNLNEYYMKTLFQSRDYTLHVIIHPFNYKEESCNWPLTFYFLHKCFKSWGVDSIKTVICKSDFKKKKINA